MTQVVSSHGIGASEIAAALGVHPHKDRITLWREKVGDLDSFQGNDASVWGQDVEPALRLWYARKCGKAIYVPPESLYHPDELWMRATPDGIALGDFGTSDDPSTWDHLFEAKNTNWRQAHRWGEPGTDEVPVEHLLQVQDNLAVTGLDWGMIAASIGGAAPALYPIQRDDELIAMLIEGGREFWRLVETRTPPPVEPTEAYAEFIAARHPFSRDAFVEADERAAAAAAELRQVRAAAAELERRRLMAENLLKQAIGEAAGLETPQGRIVWKPRRGRRVTDWEAVARDLAYRIKLAEPALSELAAKHVVEGAPSRPLITPREWSR